MDPRWAGAVVWVVARFLEEDDLSLLVSGVLEDSVEPLPGEAGDVDGDNAAVGGAGGGAVGLSSSAEGVAGALEWRRVLGS